MGIKGIYKEIGPGKRISLTKLAVDKLEETGCPFRLAIDISIWQFQAQAARGGSNPAIRTLFYRLLRLLGLSIQPIFVFDGPNKPVFKRNKRSGRGDGVATSMAKRMIRLFGFQIHDAPGEAEAECALLEQQGIVDAVLSEDVDTIMFGCKRTLRNWSSEGTKAKTPTHVSMYEVEELRRGGSGLDREGMVLVALMSGGDYIPEGIPGAGVKLACEAARAGFGKRLCQLKRADTSELNSWREWLMYELRTNESGFFRTRHMALHVPEDFPNIDVLRYYTHPVVSPASTLERLRNQTWESPIDVQGLREFTRETFDWNYRIGAIKFIRVLAPCLLVRKLMDRSTREDQGSEDIGSLQKEEMELVNTISSRRAHFSTDGTSELRISFIPTNIVGYDFQEEPDEVIDYGRDGLALNSDDDFEAMAEDEAAKTTVKKPFSPTEPDLYWMPETIAKLGIPVMVEDWEAAQRTKASKRQKAKAPKQKTKVGATSAGALNNFVKVTKNIPKSTGTSKSSVPPASRPEELPPSTAPARVRSPLGFTAAPSQTLPPVASTQIPAKTRSSTIRSSKQTKSSTTTTTKKPSRRAPAAAAEEPNTVNPWTIASSQVSPTRKPATSTATASKKSTAKAASKAIVIPSSSPPTSPAARFRSTVRRPRPIQPPKQHKGASNPYSSAPSSPFPASPSPHLPVNSSPPRNNNNNNNKRRSITPPPTVTGLQSGAGAEEWGKSLGSAARVSSPTSPWSPPPPPLPSGENPRRRKLARTESLPVEYTTPRKTTPEAAADGGKKARGFARAQTVAVDTTVLSSDSDSDPDSGSKKEGAEDEEEGEGSDLDLPPLSSFANRLPSSSSSSPSTKKAKAAAAKSSASLSLLSSSSPEPNRDQTRSSQMMTTTRTRTAAAAAAAASAPDRRGSELRMTKLYVPRKSQPGFFKEVDVTAGEAEALKAHVAAGGSGRARGRAWRRSDIECIDLTGDD